MNFDANSQQRWSDLLAQAVSEPGLILQAYSAFHGYSLGNQLAALLQCAVHQIEPGPIATYNGWLEKNRQVRRGQKAIWLCMPLTRKKTNGDTGEDELYITAFVLETAMVRTVQTDGEPIGFPEIPEWNKERGLAALGIEQVSFTHTNGNTQGYSRGRTIAISPLAELPFKTLIHEVAHVLLHTTESEISDSGETTTRSLREVEAESVSLLVCESLNLEGAQYCRGYIQNWIETDLIPERSAQRIFKAADSILKAGAMVKGPLEN